MLLLAMDAINTVIVTVVSTFLALMLIIVAAVLITDARDTKKKKAKALANLHDNYSKTLSEWAQSIQNGYDPRHAVSRLDSIIRARPEGYEEPAYEMSFILAAMQHLETRINHPALDVPVSHVDLHEAFRELQEEVAELRDAR